jgi:glycosyltransferase involved in cell wall biosynthesis
MLTVPPDMVHELAWQIRRLTASKELRQHLTRKATHYADEHAWDVIARRYATEFDELASAGPRSAGRLSQMVSQQQAT